MSQSEVASGRSNRRLKHQKAEYRSEINGLRAVAVIAATINNFWESSLPCGYLGVDMFAVISGYAITASLYGRTQNNFKEFLVSFYSRRCKRLIPALLFMVITTSLFLIFLTSGTTLIVNIRTGAAALIGMANLYLMKNASNYFAVDAKYNAFTSLWSLSSEEQYYLLFPLIVWFSGLPRNLTNSTRNLFWTVACLSLASLVGFFWLWHLSPTNAYYFMPTRFWEMGAGCLACLWYESKTREQSVNRKNFYGEIILSCLILAFFMPLSKGLIVTFVVVSLTVTLILYLNKHSLSYFLLCSSPFAFVARISYSLYLWRWATIAFILFIFGRLDNSLNLIGVFTIIAMALISTFIIEEPFRSGKILSTLHYSFLTLLALGNASILFMLSISGLVSSSISEPIYQTVKKYQEISIQNPWSPTGQSFSPKQPKILVIGSHYAMDLVPSLDRISKKLGFSGAYLIYSATVISDKKFKGLVDKQDAELNRVLPIILRDGDLIIYSRFYERIDWSSTSATKRITKEIEFLKSTASANNAKLFLINSGPKISIFYLNKPLFPIYGTLAKGEPSVRALKNRQYLTDKLRSHVDNKSTFLLDPTSVTCPKNLCRLTLNGKELYASDGYHIANDNRFVFSDFFLNNLPNAEHAGTSIAN